MQGFFARLQKQASSSVLASGFAEWIQGSSAPGDATAELGDPVLSSVNEIAAQALEQRGHGIKRHFAAIKESDYSVERDIRVLVSTYNVNGITPGPREDLRSWLLPPVDWPARGTDMGTWQGPDIIVLGFQELNALNAVNVVAGGDERNVETWQAAIACALNETPLPDNVLVAQAALDGLSSFSGEQTGGDCAREESDPRSGPRLGYGVTRARQDGEESQRYEFIKGQRMVGVYVAVWARVELKPHISSWQGCEVRTGNLGFGNKGGVAVRFRLWDEPICVVVAHLASGQTASDEFRRRADLLHISAHARFSATDAPPPQEAAQPQEAPRKGAPWLRSPLAVEQPTVVLAGDLNSRIALPDALVRERLAKGDLPLLLASDELTMRREADEMWRGWSESIIRFKPTYKYVPGSAHYVGDSLGAGEAEEQIEAGSEARGGASAASQGLGRAASDAVRSSLAISLSELTEDDGTNEVAPPVGSPGAAAAHKGGGEAAAAAVVEGNDESGGAGTGSDAAAGPAGARALVNGAGRGAAEAAESGRASPAAASASAAARTRTRTPAWTDRVLYRCADARRLQPLYYGRTELCVSDHKPVVAAFAWRVTEVERERLQAEVARAQRAIDITANKCQPRCSLLNNELSVGELKYNEVVTRTVTIQNESEVAAEWLLAAPQAPSSPQERIPAPRLALPPWVQAEPACGVLGAGQAVEVTFRIGVQNPAVAAGADPATAEWLVRQPGQRSCSLAHALAIHVAGGADHFVAIDGSFKPSFFGLTVSTLMDLGSPAGPSGTDSGCAAPAMAFDGPDFTLCKHKSPFLPSQWDTIPVQLQRLLHHLCRDACLRSVGLFADSFQMIRTETALSGAAGLDDVCADLAPVRRVAAAIDAGARLPEAATPHDVAATLLSYFKALPQPFFAPAISHLIEGAMPGPEEAASVLKASIAGTAEWSLLCCTIQLLKLLIKLQRSSDVADDAAGPDCLDEDVANMHMSLAACFAEAWFPPIGLQNMDRQASAEDYSRALMQAEETAHKQALFVQMFL